MPFARVKYQIAVDYGVSANNTVDLVPVIGIGEGLVLSRIRAVVTSSDAAYLYIFRIPSGGSETLDTAILYAVLLMPGQTWDEDNVVIEAQEGIAVGIVNVNGGTPKVVFSAFGNLESP